MNKPVAHSILALFDLAAIGAAYYALSQRELILSLVHSQSATIQYQSLLGFYFLLLLVPVIHGISLVEAWVPLKQAIKKVISYGLVSALVAAVVAAVLFSQSIESRLLSSGYHYCPENSEAFTFSTYQSFVRELEQCADN